MEQPGVEPAPIWDANVAGGGFTHSATIITPRFILIKFHSYKCSFFFLEKKPHSPLTL